MMKWFLAAPAALALIALAAPSNAQVYDVHPQTGGVDWAAELEKREEDPTYRSRELGTSGCLKLDRGQFWNEDPSIIPGTEADREEFRGLRLRLER